MTNDEALALRDQATALRDNLVNDINNAMTRSEQQRITILAHEADRLVAAITTLCGPVESFVPDLPTHY